MTQRIDPTDTLWLPMVTLWRREVVRFLRQRSRVVGALGTPVVFWLLIGSGLRNSFKAPGGASSMDYMEFAFPGMVVLIVLFTAIFSTISIIDDRKEGFLQAVLASPASRFSIVAGKVLGSTTLALIQAIPFLLVAPLIGLSFTVGSVVQLMLVLFVVAVALSALGVLIAWPMDSTQGFHAVMNLFLMPMWLLSGSFFPATGASKWLTWVMVVNPLTYGVAAVRHALYAGSATTPQAAISPMMDVLLTGVFAVVTVWLAVYVVRREVK